MSKFINNCPHCDFLTKLFGWFASDHQVQEEHDVDAIVDNVVNGNEFIQCRDCDKKEAKTA